MQKRKQKRLILSIIIFVLLLTTTIFYSINNNSIKEPKIKNNNNTSQNQQKDNQDNSTKPTIPEYQNRLPDYRTQYNNQNIVAVLKIPALNIETIVTRSNDNTYYLNHDIYNNYNELGNTFVDFRNTDLTNNRQLNIYGHNTPNPKYYSKLPFVKLQQYTNKEFFDNNKQVILDVDEKSINYEAVAVKIITNSDNEHMKLSFNNESEWTNHLNKLLNNTLYNDQKPLENSQILVLQVCNYNPPDTYLLIICKRT